MRILITTGIYPPDVGGPAGYVEKIAKEFVAMGHQVRVLTYSDGLDGEIIKDGYRLFFVRRKNKVLNYFSYFLRVFECAKGADVIYLQDSVSAGFPTTLANLFLRKRLVLKIVGDYAWEMGGNKTVPILDDFYSTTSVIASDQVAIPSTILSLRGAERSGATRQSRDSSLRRGYCVTLNESDAPRNNRKIEILKRIQTWVAKKADKIITPSEYLKKIVNKGWGIEEDKISAVYNSTTSVIQKNLNTPGGGVFNENIILSVGRLVPWKGFDTLIELMPEILKVNPEAELVIIGEGPEKENLFKLRDKILKTREERERVIIHGKMPHEELLRKLKSYGIFVLNTRYEGLSHILLEALSCGVPVITTNVGGNPEVIKDYENGYLVNFNDKIALKNSIIKLWENKEIKNNFIKNGFKSLEKFKFPKMIKDTEDILKFKSPGLRVLMISTDKTILDENSTSAERMRDYGKICDNLQIIVFNTDKLRDGVKLSGNVFTHPTNSINKPLAIFDCINIGNKIIGEENINVITTQDPFETGFIGWRLARKHKIGLNVQMHGDFYGNDYWVNESSLNKIRDKLGKLVLKKAGSVRVVSPRIERSLREGLDIKKNIIMAPISTVEDAIKLKDTSPSFSLKEKYPDNYPILLSVSRLEKEKNFPFLFDVFKKTLEKFPKALLFIVGDGSMKKELEERVKRIGIEEKVKFEGFQKDLVSYYKTSDIYLLTSDYEGWGRTVVDAGVCGSAMVLSNVGCVDYFEMTTQGVFVSNVRDKDRFSKNIIEMAKKLKDEPDLYEKMRDKGDRMLLLLESKEAYLEKIKKSWELAKF